MELTVNLCFSFFFLQKKAITEVAALFLFSGYFDEQVEADVVKLKVSWLVTCAVDSVINIQLYYRAGGGAMASWSVHSSADRAVRVRALAGDIVLCSWARHFTLTVSAPPRCINGYRRT